MRQWLKSASILLFCLILLTGCGTIRIEDNPQVRANVDLFLAGLLRDDPDAASGAVYDGIDPAELDAAYLRLREAVSGVTEYTLEPIQYNYRKLNGVATTELGYRMDTNAGTFLVVAAMTEGCDGLTTLHILPENQTRISHTGTLGHMKGASLFQWILLFLGAMAWGFTIWMIVDCCRRKLNRKVLWLLLLIFGSLIFSFSFSGGNLGFQVNFGLHLMLSSLIRYSDGSVQLALMVPVGSIIYCARRSKLTLPTEQPEQQELTAE